MADRTTSFAKEVEFDKDVYLEDRVDDLLEKAGYLEEEFTKEAQRDDREKGEDGRGESDSDTSKGEETQRGEPETPFKGEEGATYEFTLDESGSREAQDQQRGEDWEMEREP